VGVELQAAIIGALIGGGFVLIGSVLQHFLSLREDSVKRQRDEIYAESERLRKRLLAGVSEASARGTYEHGK